MKKLFVLFILALPLFAQEKEDTLLFTWIPRGVAGFNVSQIAFTNWTQGGDNSITWTATGNFSLNYMTPGYASKNSLKIAYGRTKLGNDDFRTNDNEFYLEDVFSYNIGWQIDPYFSNTIRTQVTSGYKYSDETETKISDFFDPGYITQSLGFTYNNSEVFISRLGVALQEVFTNKFRQYSDHPNTADKTEAFKIETGVESVSESKLKLDDNLLFNSKLRLFTRFDHMDVWDVRWDNAITAVVSKYINVNLNTLMIYEKNQSLKTQLKQALLLGLNYSLF